MTGYYFGLYELPPEADKTAYHGYYFSPGRRLRQKISFSNCLFEAVFTAPMGMTMRYEQQEGAYQPVQSRRNNPNATVLEANLHILKDVLADEKTIPWVLSLQEKDHRKMTEDLLSSFMGQPSKEEAEAYGNLLFSDDVTEEHLRPVAAPLSAQEIRDQRLVSKALILAGIKKSTIHESAWLEGSILRLGSHVADNLRHARWYKAFVYLRKDVKAHRRQSHLQ